MSRSHHFEVEIQASPEEVWDLITTGEGIKRWFAPEASVTPGEGGKIFLSWGPGMEGEAPITIWEPGRRFGWKEQHGDAPPKTVEMILEAKSGGTTILRLVHSGFGADASFDNEYDSTLGGWRSFLRLIQHECAENQSLPARHLFRMQFLERDRVQLLQTLLARIGYSQTGDRYTAHVPNGPAIQGRVLLDKPAGYLMLSLDAPHAGALALFSEACGPSTGLTTSWHLRGDSVALADQLGPIWDELLKHL